MTEKELKNILKKGEGFTVEFKKSQTNLPLNLFETICAFLNRLGGDLFLGVKDNGDVIGIKPDRVNQIKNDLVTLSNNPNKLDPPFVLFPEEIEIDGKTVIYIRVPMGSQVHRTANIVYDRSEDGDFRVQTHEGISRIYARKNAYFTENKIYPYLQFSDFNASLFPKVRNLISSHRPDHPWLSLSNEEMLKMAGLYKSDFETGKQGYTLAAALLFGKDDVIQQILPFHKTDALLRRIDLDHYDDRKVVQTNLIDAYDEILQFIRTHLPDKFYLEGDIRIDLREKIFREVVANMLIHREFTNAFLARLIIYEDKLVTENANNPFGAGTIDLNNYAPHPKNPVIARFFQQLGRAEELGSGIKNIKKYLPLYSRGATFKFIEGDIFKTIIEIVNVEIDRVIVKYDAKGPGSEISMVKDKDAEYKSDSRALTRSKQVVESLFGNEVAKKVKKRLAKELAFIVTEHGIAHQQIKNLTGVERATAQRDMKLLVDKGLVKFSGPLKTGKYILTEFGINLFHRRYSYSWAKVDI